MRSVVVPTVSVVLPNKALLPNLSPVPPAVTFTPTVLLKIAQLAKRIVDPEENAEMPVPLPPGLAKRAELPPGLERQLVVRGTLPPGLRSRMHPCPVEVEQFLPPPPVGYVHTVIGGNIVLVNTRTFFVMDVFRF